MPSPIFSYLLLKPYLVQTRSGPEQPWQDHRAYKRLDEAKRTVQQLLRQNPTTQVRIVNRRTGQVM